MHYQGRMHSTAKGETLLSQPLALPLKSKPKPYTLNPTSLLASRVLPETPTCTRVGYTCHPGSKGCLQNCSPGLQQVLADEALIPREIRMALS